MIKYISDAPHAPKAIGPYSQAVITGNTAFLAGQIPLNPATGEIVGDGIEPQAEQVMNNIAAVLAHIGLDLSHVVKTTIFLTDLGNFQTVNSIYERWMKTTKPARSTVQVAGLPRGSKVEIEVVAVLEK
jgi:2-iminobutanoate/2-iminopropanoate deaminase